MVTSGSTAPVDDGGERADHRLRRRLTLVAGGATTILAIGIAAFAFWTIGGDGSASAGTGTLIAPTNAAASAPVNSTTVSVSWNGAALGTGQAASGYYVTRIRSSDGASFAACGTSPSVTVPGVSCDDLGVNDGDYHYTVTATYGSWTALSAASASVHVVNDNSLPNVLVSSISPSPNGNGWHGSSPVTVNLSASAGLGVESITYTVDSAPPTTVMAATAAASVSGDGLHTVQFFARDTIGQESASGSVLVRIDTVAPDAPSAPVLAAASDSGSSSTDSITKVMTPTFSGTAENGSTVTLYDGAAAVGTAVATSDGYTAVSSTLSNGSHTLTTRATDPAGNVGPASAGTTVTIDATAPVAPTAPTLTADSDSGSSNSDRITNVTTPTFTGTAEIASSITLYSASTSIGTTLASDGTYAVTASALAAGVKQITVTATDVAGNVGPASSSNSITIDITAPVKPATLVLAAASDSGRSATDRNTKVTTPTLTGTTTAATTVTLYDGTTLIGSVYAPTTAYSITSSTLGDASHVITTKATDAAGNLGPASTAITVIVDTVAPTSPSAPKPNAASDTGRSSTDGITKVTSPVIAGTNESKAIVTLYDGITQLGLVTTSTTTYSITAPALAEGNHTLTATATDTAGNVGPASAGAVTTIDTIAPTTSASTPTMTTATDTGTSNVDGITKTTAPVFTGTAATGDSVRLFDGGVATGSLVTVVGGAYSQPTSTLSNGSRTITAVETDAAGNAAPITPGVSVTIDTVVPTGTINQAAGQADPTTEQINFTAVFSEPVSGFISADVTFTGTALATTSTLSGVSSPYNVAVGSMTKSGTVIAAITASKVTDIAGNNNLAATFTDNTVTYTDTTAPAAPSAPRLLAASDTGSSSTDGITKTTTPTFTGTAEAGSTVRILDGAAQVGSGVATVGGTYSIVSSALVNGTHSMSATATDSTGNLSPASPSTSVTIDTVLPTVTLNQAAGQSDPTTSTPVNFTLAFSEPVTGVASVDVTYSGTAGTLTSAISGSGASYNVATSGMTKTGTVIASFATSGAQDLAGNNSAAATYSDRTVTYTDTVAPVVAITGFTAAVDGSQTATVNGTADYGMGDNLTVTVVLCTQATFPCIAGNTKATLTGVPVSPTTGAWTVTSATLGTTSTLYARATQTDLTGNIGTSTVAGPVAID